MLDITHINKNLQLCNALHNSHEYMDMHVHPIDIITKHIDYFPDKNIKGIYSRNIESKYVLPKIEPINCELDKSGIIFHDENIKNKIELLMSRKRYDNIGPKVFEDLMKLGGIDKVLLLPVAPCEGEVEEQMRMLVDMYGNNDKFIFAYSVSNGIKNDCIYDSLNDAVLRYGIKAVKLHPNITGIDLAAKEGIERTEALLSACDRLMLPVVVHGGKSTFLESRKAREYAVISHLENVDWGLAHVPIVISHAGGYGIDQEEMESVVLPKLKIMLNRFENMVVDTSGIDIRCLTSVLKNVEDSRIVFGSDALYHVQWLAIIYLIESIKNVYKNVEEILLKIISFNTSKIFNK